ncbi:hypothetical protein [Nocardia violaceofusca]|uniref:hypothetical protein n=1 Tax=Nocardia violaceofusca TaxID=941182 RepID=UPI000AD9E965|nr:hypothetical protein [Nocardia violaceofusca]
MMTSFAPITARAVLFDGAAPAAGVGEPAECLRECNVDQLALRCAPVVTGVLRSAALHELATAVDGLFEVDLGRVMVEGWRRYDRLRRAALRTRGGGVEQVELFEHEITRTCRPHLDVTVDGNHVGELALELCIAALLQPLAATVRDGMPAALGPGDCIVTVSIDAPEAGPIMQREHTFHVATMVYLGRPIPLIAHPAPPPTSPGGDVPR